MQRLMVLGLNHITAPLPLRERLAFSPEQCRDALARLRDRFTACEAVLLSTCNRVELYVARQTHEHPRLEELADWLGHMRGIPAAEFQSHLYHKTDRAVVQHLFTVAASLDSMVLGETQILGQVRDAYDIASAAGVAGPMLHPLFQRAIAVGRQVHTDTRLADGRLSAASVAVDYARRIFDSFSDKTVLSVGAGKMASLVLSHLASLQPGELLICNRDPAKAAELAARFQGKAVAYESLADHLAAADIVLTSTGAPAPIITRKLFDAVMRRRRYRPVYLIDIAVPRDVAGDVGEMENVYLYNIDDLQQVVAATRGERGAAADAAARIVAEQARQFALWHRARQLGPFIDQLYRRSHELARQEIDRTLAKLPPDVSPGQREHLEELARRIVNKLLHDPIQMLRDSDSAHGPASQYLHAMEKLFKLSEPPASDPPGGDPPGSDPPDA